MDTNFEKIFVSYADSITKADVKRIRFIDIFDDIINGTYSKLIKVIRKIKDKKKRSDYKRNYLPYFTFARFKDNIRKNDNFEYTRYLIFDIDNISTTKIELFKKIFTLNKKIFCCFTSPSGNGLKIIFKLNRKVKDKSEYKIIYNHLKSYLSKLFKTEIDNTIDPARTCYLSYDPDIILIKDCQVINVDEIELPALKKPKAEFSQKDIDLSILPSIIKFLSDKIDNYSDWIKIGFALASLGETGREHFVNLSLNNSKY